MPPIGRLDVVKAVKQYFELAGNLELDLSEGILPVALLADLSKPPFSAALGWMGNTDAGAAVAAEKSWAGIRLASTAPRGSRLTIDRLFVVRGAIEEFYIDIFGDGTIPGETIAAQTALDVTTVGRGAGNQERVAPHVELIGGNEPALAPNRGYRFAGGYTQGVLVPIDLPPITLVPGSAAAVICASDQQSFSLGAWGYLHIGGGR